jgi:hypothetical protein
VLSGEQGAVQYGLVAAPAPDHQIQVIPDQVVDRLEALEAHARRLAGVERFENNPA